MGVLFLTPQVGPELFGIVLHVSKYDFVDILVMGFPSLSLYCCFSCLYLAQSFVLFVCLALENAFCRLRSKRLMSVVIHGFDGLFLEIFDGTRPVMITDIAFLKSFHMSFTDVYCVLMVFSVASCIWLPMMDLSALSTIRYFLG